MLAIFLFLLYLMFFGNDVLLWHPDSWAMILWRCLWTLVNFWIAFSIYPLLCTLVWCSVTWLANIICYIHSPLNFVLKCANWFMIHLRSTCKLERHCPSWPIKVVNYIRIVVQCNDTYCVLFEMVLDPPCKFSLKIYINSIIESMDWLYFDPF